MHLPLIIAFGAKLALGHFSNTSDSWPQSDDDAAAQPWVVGDFRFFGCAASTAGFPLFKKVAFTDFMNLDFCAASCPGRYFGTSDKDCYCGDELDAETADKVDSDQCDTPCPGDGSQICGGRSASDWDKQSPSSVVTLSLYIRLGENHYEQRDHEDEDTCEEEKGDSHGGWQFTRPPPHQTYTSTITSTTTSTITSCAPDVPHCPLGDRVVQAVTVTTELCPTPEWSRKKITCYGDHCAPDEPCREGDDDDEQCQRQRVVCNGESCHPEPCSDKDDDWHKLVVCDDNDNSDCHYRQCAGEECGTKIVCYDGQCAKQKCWGDECRTKFVCKGPECRHEACEDGEDCHAHHVCSESGDDCQAQSPCSGPECPVPPPPVSKPESPAFKPWYPAASEPESPASKPESPAYKPESPAPTQHRPGHETAYPQPAAPTNGYSLPHPTGVPVVAGSTQLGATLFGVLLSFVVFL